MSVQSPNDPGEPSIPDEVWAKFEQDSLRDIRASDAPKEPSARARMVAERLRRLDEEASREQGGRGSGRARRFRGRGRRGREDRGAAGAWRPDAWRAAPDGPYGGRSGDPRRERRRRVWSVVIVVGGMALAIAFLSPYGFWPWQR